MLPVIFCIALATGIFAQTPTVTTTQPATTLTQQSSQPAGTGASPSGSQHSKRWGYGYPGFGGYYGSAAPGQFSGYGPGFAGSYNNGQFSGYAPGFAGSYNSVRKRDSDANTDWSSIGNMCYLAAQSNRNDPTFSQCASSACRENSIQILNRCFGMQESPSSRGQGG
ncbi:hypothetical protein HDV01_004211 [Terramyces sp. JEL0728]|nr:hypothetical protein HDV01_004211 [Terramyces sp. JEL0728]